MSTTYNLECLDCKEQMWLGQRDYIYIGELDTMELLRVFLFVHENHNLRFVSEHHSNSPGEDGWIGVTEKESDATEEFQFYKHRWKDPKYAWFMR